MWMKKSSEKMSAVLFEKNSPNLRSTRLSNSQLAAKIICARLIPNFEVGTEIANNKRPKRKINDRKFVDFVIINALDFILKEKREC